MGRYTGFVKSASGLAVDTAFASLVPAAAIAFKIRRIQVGVTCTGTPTVQQVTIGINRGTARGTATTTVTLGKLDPRSATSGITGMDTVWSSAPTLASTDLFRLPPFNTQGGLDAPWEQMEELWSDIGTANPLVFVNRDQALPAGHSLVLSVETEE